MAFLTRQMFVLVSPIVSWMRKGSKSKTRQGHHRFVEVSFGPTVQHQARGVPKTGKGKPPTREDAFESRLYVNALGNIIQLGGEAHRLGKA